MRTPVPNWRGINKQRHDSTCATRQMTAEEIAWQNGLKLQITDSNGRTIPRPPIIRKQAVQEHDNSGNGKFKMTKAEYLQQRINGRSHRMIAKDTEMHPSNIRSHWFKLWSLTEDKVLVIIAEANRD